MTSGDVTAVEKPGADTPATAAEQSDEGPFTTRQLLRLDEALRLADLHTGLTFSIYLGELEEPTRAAAEQLHARIRHPERAVLLAVSPNQRKLEIVTGNEARKRISDRDAQLAGFSMAASFGGGDLAGGLLQGINVLATQAGKS